MLRQWMSEQPGYEYEVERIFHLLQKLDNARTREDPELFIG